VQASGSLLIRDMEMKLMKASFRGLGPTLMTRQRGLRVKTMLLMPCREHAFMLQVDFSMLTLVSDLSTWTWKEVSLA
jgi:hypothetical protein